MKTANGSSIRAVYLPSTTCAILLSCPSPKGSDPQHSTLSPAPRTIPGRPRAYRPVYARAHVEPPIRLRNTDRSTFTKARYTTCEQPERGESYPEVSREDPPQRRHESDQKHPREPHR